MKRLALLWMLGLTAAVTLPQDFLSLSPTGSNIRWRSQRQLTSYRRREAYLPQNIITTRVQIYRDIAFLVTPRYRSGVPFTLGKLSLRSSRRDDPCLEPYPDWAVHEGHAATVIHNAVDIFLDSEGVLWVLDVGLVNTLEHSERRGPPKAIGISAKTGKVLHSVNLSRLVTEGSKLQFVVAERASHKGLFLYVTDATSKAILVWDVLGNRGFRVILPQDATSKDIDVLYIALVPARKSGVLYFTYLSSGRMYAVKTKDLRQGNTQESIRLVGSLPGKMVILGTDGRSSIFFRLKGADDIYEWRTGDALTPHNALRTQRSAGGLRLATQVAPGYRNTIWVLESNFQDYIRQQVGSLGANIRLHPLHRTFRKQGRRKRHLVLLIGAL